MTMVLSEERQISWCVKCVGESSGFSLRLRFRLGEGRGSYTLDKSQ